MSFIDIKNLKVHYPIRGGFFNRIVDHVYAVDGVDLMIEKGKTYGLVGESGSGKSTIGKAIIGLEKIKDGTIIAEPLRNFENLTDKEERKRVSELLEIVGMTDDALYKYPHEFSGGQRQRIGVARAVAIKPKLIIADEPVSALDLSVQAQVLNYMKEIQKQFGLSYLFISHDLGVVKHMCDHISIMYRGRFVETGKRDDIYNNPQHIYTKRLIAAIPEVNPNHRESNKSKRLAVEKEYKENELEYYDKNGKVYDLQKLTDTHYVALAHKVKGGEK